MNLSPSICANDTCLPKTLYIPEIHLLVLHVVACFTFSYLPIRGKYLLPPNVQIFTARLVIRSYFQRKMASLDRLHKVFGLFRGLSCHTQDHPRMFQPPQKARQTCRPCPELPGKARVRPEPFMDIPCECLGSLAAWQPGRSW